MVDRTLKSNYYYCYGDGRWEQPAVYMVVGWNSQQSGGRQEQSAVSVMVGGNSQ